MELTRRIGVSDIHLTIRLVILFACFLETFSVSQEICQLEKFTATCAHNEVIIINNATYGRMHINRCISKDMGHAGCGVSVKRQTVRMCSGRRSCEFVITAKSFDNPRTPCQMDMRAYFEVNYECLKVATAIGLPKCSPEGDMIIRQSIGYISNVYSELYGVGSVTCPWRIEVPSGQKLNITLIDFSWTDVSDNTGESDNDTNTTTAEHEGTAVCQRQYARLTEEEGMARILRICGGDRRERVVYTSRANVVQIQILPKRNPADKPVYFLIKFEAIGCADPPSPVNGWVKRLGNSATLGCEETEETLNLTCNGTKWYGEYDGVCYQCNGSGRQFNPNYSQLMIIMVLIFSLIACW